MTLAVKVALNPNTTNQPSLNKNTTAPESYKHKFEAVRKKKRFCFKGGHLDISHLAELKKNLYIKKKTIQIINN